MTNNHGEPIYHADISQKCMILFKKRLMPICQSDGLVDRKHGGQYGQSER